MNMHQSIQSALLVAASVILPATIAMAQSAVSVSGSGQSAAQGGGSGGKRVAVRSGPGSATGGTATVVTGGGDKDSTHSVTVITNKDDDSGKTIELRIENGQMTVKCDGKEIADSQIKREDGQVIILDADGKEIQRIGVGVLGHGVGDVGGLYGWTSGDSYAKALGGMTMFGGEDQPAPKLMLGIHMTEPGPALGKHLHINPEECLMISGVYKGLPADDAGIEQYDIIVKIDGKTPADRAALRKVLDGQEPGESVTLSIIHEGKGKDVKVKLTEYDAEALAKAEVIGGTGDSMIFQRFNSNDPLAAKQFKFDRLFMSPNGQWQFAIPEQSGLGQMRVMEKLQGITANTEDADDRLENLNKKMEKLEMLLEKLMEQNSQKP